MRDFVVAGFLYSEVVLFSGIPQRRLQRLPGTDRETTCGRRVLRVLAHRITALDPGTGLTANVGTSLLVLFATPLGLPASTTHVSTGALLGIRWARNARPDGQDALRMILFGWVITLPITAGMAALSVLLLHLHRQ